MSFLTDKNKPISRKVVLFEIDIPTKNGELDVLLNYEAGIWFCRLAPGVVTPEDDYGVFGYYENTLADDGLDVGSVIVKDTQYLKVLSIDELRLQDSSFYYDLETTDLYLHFNRWHKPVNYKWIDFITVGAITGYSMGTDPTHGAYYDNIYYPSRVESIPSLNKKKDRLFYGLVSFNGGSITLNNEDGFFDNFRDLDIYGQPCRIYAGFEGYERDEMRQVYAGFIDSYSWDFDKFVIRASDPRKRLTTPLPVNVISVDDYADLDEDDEDKFKPIIYGRVNGCEVIPLNPKALAGDYDFMVMDTEFHDMTEVYNVYIDGVLVDPLNWSETVADGTITIDRGQFSDEPSGVTVDVKGVNITNAGAVMKDLLLNYGSLAFIASNFNTAEFNSVMAKSRQVAFRIAETEQLIKVIENICVANDSIFLVQDNGRFTLRRYIPARTPIKTIEREEFLSLPSVKINEDLFLSSAIILYNENLDTGKRLRYRNTDYEAEVLAKYKGLKEKTFETILTSRTDAIAKSEVIMNASKVIREEISISAAFKNVDLEVMDFVIAQPLKRETGPTRWAIYEVLGINKNLERFEIELDLLFVDWYTPEPPATTQGGILWNHYLWGDKLYQEAGEI